MGAFVLSSEERRLKEKVTICSSLQHAGKRKKKSSETIHARGRRAGIRKQPDPPCGACAAHWDDARGICDLPSAVVGVDGPQRGLAGQAGRQGRGPGSW